MKRRDAPHRAAKVYQADELISIVDAITLLADRDRRTHDVDRSRKARMRHHIQYAVENDQLSEVIRKGEKHYVFGRLAAWAQGRWRGRYDDLPSIRDVITGGMVARAFKVILD